MPQLHAQPYDITANGFYFESLEDYAEKANSNLNDYGDPVEEYEIQFIDGDHIDCDLAKAWGINQVNIGQYFNACESWDDQDKTVFIIAVGEAGYSFDPYSVSPSDFDVDIYHVDSMKELAEQFVDEGMFGEIPEHLTNYIDMDAKRCKFIQDEQHWLLRLSLDISSIYRNGLLHKEAKPAAKCVQAISGKNQVDCHWLGFQIFELEAGGLHVFTKVFTVQEMGLC